MNNIIYLNCRVCGKRIVNKKEDLQSEEVREGFCSDCYDIADDLIDEFEQTILEKQEV